MPITAYTGLPGHGKSYAVVEHVILPALRAGRCVVTNVPMNVELVRAEIAGADLRSFDTDCFAEYVAKLSKLRDAGDRQDLETKLRVALDEAAPAGCVWVVDECWRLWPAGQREKDVAEPFRAILAEHRHRVNEGQESMQVVLVTQDLAQIGTFARRLVEETFRTSKLGVLGFSKRYRVDVYQGAAQGQRPPERLRVRQEFGKYSSKVWRFYKSHTKSEAVEGGADESKVDRRAVIWRSPVMYIGGPAVLLLFVVGIVGTWRFFHPKPIDKPVATGAKLGQRGAARPVAGSPGRADTWRIVASVEGAGMDLIYMQAGDRWVSLPISRYCDKDVAGFFICEFEGQRISGQVRYLPPVPAAQPGPGSVLTSSFPGG